VIEIAKPHPPSTPMPKNKSPKILMHEKHLSKAIIACAQRAHAAERERKLAETTRRLAETTLIVDWDSL
jgi:hypothetical protein